jgi:hypothetical protein
MNNELGRIGKEEIVVSFKVLSQHHWGEPRVTSLWIVGIPAEIRTRNFKNTTQEWYSYTELFGTTLILSTLCVEYFRCSERGRSLF